MANRWTGPNWPDFALGQRVTFSTILVRDHEGERHFWRTDKLLQPMSGIVVQLTTLRDTEDTFEHGDYGTILSKSERVTRTFPAVLIAFDKRRKPVLVARVAVKIAPATRVVVSP